MAREWWVGAYGADMDGSSTGISLMTARDDGSLEVTALAAEIQSPTFLARRGDHVYAVGEGSGTVTSFTRDGDMLVADGSTSTGGVWPCHIELLDDALVAANYFDGTLGVVSLHDGAVHTLAQVVQGEGSGPHEAQAGPHAHASIRLDDSTLASVDLGADRVLLHSVVGNIVTRTGTVQLPPGTGPRDIARHPSGLIYVLGELSCTMHVFEFVGGMLEPVSSAPLPSASPGDQAAAIAFGPEGFIYAGIRGANLIAALHGGADGRELTPVGAVSTEGEWPRHLTIDGGILHVANQLSNSVASFRLGSDGLPILIAKPTTIASPTYLLAAV